MFKFKFQGETGPANPSEQKGSSETLWLQSEEIKPSRDLLMEELFVEGTPLVSTLDVNSTNKFRYVTPNVVLNRLERNGAANVGDNSIFQAEKQHSDLLPAIYEDIGQNESVKHTQLLGGLKIWECTYDLINYITTQELDFINKRVLDLGCGAGILGILAITKGATVYFQDYNSEVIKYTTIPNILLNTELRLEDEKLKHCKFYSGDWESFLTETQNDFQSEESKFDYIFTSETIYNIDNYLKLHNVFKQRLKQDGVIYLAAKSYYFGVGGGLRQFEDLLVKQNVFNFSNCWKCSGGVQREILRLSFNKSYISL